MHPGGPLEGTHLHDYEGEMIEKRPNKSLVPGDCYGYCGSNDWWYLYDDKNNVLKMSNNYLREEKIILDNCRNAIISFEEVAKLFSNEDGEMLKLVENVPPPTPGEYRLFKSDGWYFYSVPENYILINDKNQKELLDMLLNFNVPFEEAKKIISKENTLKNKVRELKQSVESLKKTETECGDVLRKLELENKIATEKFNELQATSNHLSKPDELDNQCKICLEARCDVVFTPCGHVCSCKNCASQLSRKCPICRKVSKKVNLFYC